MSADKETGTAVATTEPKPAGAEVERFVSETGIALPGDRELSALWRMAKAFAHMPGLAAQYKAKPEAVMAAALTLHCLDLPVTPVTINQLYDVQGRLYPSTQLLVALGAKHGVEVWFADDCGPKHAVAFCKRRGEERVHSYTYTIEMATKAGLTKKDVWQQHPEIMLRYRASSRLLRTVAPDVILGVPRNVLDGEGVPAVSRAELESKAVEVTVLDSEEVDDADWDERPFTEGDDE